MDYASVLGWTLNTLAGFGLAVLLLLAWMGLRMVYLALSFAVTLAYAEHKARRLRKASADAQQALAPSPADFDQPTTTAPDNNGKNQQANTTQGSQPKGG